MPAMTMEGISLLGRDAADVLHATGSVRIEFQPGNGTRYDVLVVRDPDRVGPENGNGGNRLFVAVLNYGTVYEFAGDDVPVPWYLADKLASGNGADGAALHLLMAALLGVDSHASLADAGVR
jgi:hypothetical protein